MVVVGRWADGYESKGMIESSGKNSVKTSKNTGLVSVFLAKTIRMSVSLLLVFTVQQQQQEARHTVAGHPNSSTLWPYQITE